MTEYAFETAKQSSAAIFWSFAGQTLPGDAATPFSSYVPVAYQSTIAAAFARWSSVSGLIFSQVTDAATVPIRIGFGSFYNLAELGETDFRIGSRGIIAPDARIRLLDPATVPLVDDGGTYVYAPYYDVSLYQVALHEIGHALGLDHTTDPYTVMYPYVSPLNTDLAPGDIYGINALYPFFTVAALDPIQAEGDAGQTRAYHFAVTRYSDPSLTSTISYRLTAVAYPSLVGSATAAGSEFIGGGFPSGQLTFLAGSRVATLTVTVAGNTQPQPDQGFAVNLFSTNPLDSVTVRGTTNAVILDDDGYGQLNASSLGVYRFFDQSDGTHFYSTSLAERNTLLQSRPDLRFEGFGLHAILATADPTALPVFRFFDTGDGTHFYTISTLERDALIANRADLKFEGTAFYEHGQAQAGDSAVYRFFSANDGTHFYTASATERATILATRSDLRDEGVAFYAPSA